MSTNLSKKSRRISLTLAEKILSLITAIVVLAGAVLAIKAQSATSAKNDAQSAVTSQSNTVDSLTTRLKAAQSSLSAADASIDTLQSELAASAAPSAATPTTSKVGGSIWHAGELIVTSSSKPADLDAPATDSQWGRTAALADSNAEVDVFSNGQLYVGSSTQDAGLDTGTVASFDVCSKYPGYGSTSFQQLHDKDVLCFFTDQHRYASLTVRGTPMPNQITFDVVVYQAVS